MLTSSDIDKIRARLDTAEAHAEAGGKGTPANLMELVNIGRRLLAFIEGSEEMAFCAVRKASQQPKARP